VSHIWVWTRRVAGIYISVVVINGQEFSPSTIEWISAAISSEPDISRTRLSRQVCERLDWRSPSGKLKELSCRLALNKLHDGGHLKLPAARPRPGSLGRCRVEFVVTDQAPALDCGLKELGTVELVRINSRDSKASRIWNSLMERHHYLGRGPLCGAQIRYLIRSSVYGWVGGLAFSAPAWRLRPRDQWIGWSDAARTANLAKVVCNSRFLILPQVRVPYLASHALSLAARRLAADWVERYGIRPVLLETFVEQGRFAGTCYRAANWVEVGSTQGRGRQDRDKSRDVAVKSVYLYCLDTNARQTLCDGPVCLPPVVPTQTDQDWVMQELGRAQLGDKRLVNRLVTITRDLYARPQANIPEACGSRARAKAAYRFFDHGANAMKATLGAHYEATARRASEKPVVLAVQDTTTLNYSTHPATTDLGLIGSKQGGPIGLLVHDTMAFDVQGTPLGLIDVQCWARNPADFGKKAKRYELDIKDKESYKWLISFDAATALQKQCPDTMVVSVGDREADIYELFVEALTDNRNAKVLVRAQRDRVTADGQGHVWDHVASLPLCGIYSVMVPRRGKTAARQADLHIRFAHVTLKPPKRKPSLGPLSIWAVLAEEKSPPEGVEPLQWMLLTTVETEDVEQAIERLQWYAKRWGIEVFHKTLKSGCKIETRQLGSADRIEACLAIDMVVAWRIYHLTKLGRQTPDVPCSVYFEEHEWKALVFFKTHDPDSINHEPTLREAIRMVASLGGFLGRKCDGEPGTQTLWLGLQRLDDIAASWLCAILQFAPHVLSNPPPVSRPPTYG